MSTGALSYDPERVGALLERARAVADHLGRLESEDPLAADAMTVARTVLSHVVEGWMPALQAVAGSRALLDLLEIRPIPLGLTNDEAFAAAQAAATAGRPGVFVGTTETFEVIETPPSTTIPRTGYDPAGGSGQYDVIVTERWYDEYNLGQQPAVFSVTPGGPIPNIVARLLGRKEVPEDVVERGRELEAKVREARSSPRDGSIAARRNVAAGRLTKSDGEEIEYQAVSGEQNRDGSVENPQPGRRVFVPKEGREFDTEVKILEDVVRQVPEGNTDGTLEIFTELQPCDSCSRILEEFHDMYPNIQIRIYYRVDVLAG